MPDRRLPRRSFLTAIAAATGAAAIVPAFARGALAAQAPAPGDLAWLDELHGQHKQFFDVGKIEDAPGPLHVVANYLDAFRDVYHLESPDVNVIVGIAGSAFPINAGSALWAKYNLGSRWQLSDGPGGDVRHNIFLDAPAAAPTRASVKGLQARGAIFTQCDKALHAVARELALAFHRPAGEVYADLASGLNPGVRIVPANTIACGLAQEHGCSYQSV
jgi:hypothetical protein